jgi:hypothetical protein
MKTKFTITKWQEFLFMITPSSLAVFVKYHSIAEGGLYGFMWYFWSLIGISILIVISGLFVNHRISSWGMPSLAILLLTPWEIYYRYYDPRDDFLTFYSVLVISCILGCVLFVIYRRTIKRSAWIFLFLMLAIQSIVFLLSSFLYYGFPLDFTIVFVEIGRELLFIIPILGIGLGLFQRHGKGATLFVTALAPAFIEFTLFRSGLLLSQQEFNYFDFLVINTLPYVGYLLIFPIIFIVFQNSVRKLRLYLISISILFSIIISVFELISIDGNLSFESGAIAIYTIITLVLPIVLGERLFLIED